MCATLLCASAAHAQEIDDALGEDSISNKPMLLVITLLGLALIPLVILMVTSFVKIAVVLAIVRQAIGTPQIPPTQVLTGVAFVLSFFVMTPVLLDTLHGAKNKLDELGVKELTLKGLNPTIMAEMVKVAREPLRKFLVRHAHPSDLKFFLSLGTKMRRNTDSAALDIDDFAVITPSFVMTELKEAFQIGFVLFMPFLVVDMVIGNILMALGMQMLSPNGVGLPFKILLFVMVDGWHLLAKGLVLGYT